MALRNGYPFYFVWTEERLQVLREMSKEIGMEYMTPAGCPKSQAKRHYDQFVEKMFLKGRVPYNFTLEMFQEKLAEVVKERFYNTY